MNNRETYPLLYTTLVFVFIACFGVYWGWMDDPMLDLIINGNFNPQFQNIDALASGFHTYLQYVFRFLYQRFPFSIGWMAVVSLAVCLFCLYVILKSYSKALSPVKLYLLSAALIIVLFREIYLYTNINLVAFAVLAAVLLSSGKQIFFYSKRIDYVLAGLFFLLGIQSRLLAAVYFFLFFLVFILLVRRGVFNSMLKPLGLFIISILFFLLSLSFFSSTNRTRIADVDQTFFYYGNMGIPLKPVKNEVDKIRNIGILFWFAADENIFKLEDLDNSLDFEATLKPFDRIARKFETFGQMLIDYPSFEQVYHHKKDLIFWLVFNLLIIVYYMYKNRKIAWKLLFFFIWYLLGLLGGIIILYMPARLLFPILSFYYVLVLIYVYTQTKPKLFFVFLTLVLCFWQMFEILLIHQEKSQMTLQNERLINDIQHLETTRPMLLDVFSMSILHKSPLKNDKVSINNTLITDTYLFPFETNSYNEMYAFCDLENNNSYLSKMNCLLDGGGYYFVGNESNLKYRLYLLKKYYGLVLNYQNLSNYDEYASFMYYNSNENIFFVERGEVLQFNLVEFEETWLRVAYF